MSAGHYDFTIEQGANFSKTITWKDQAGAGINIHGYTIRMMARNEYTDAAPVITLSTVPAIGGISITDEANGVFALSMTAAQTAALNFSLLKYDLEVQSPEGVVTRLLEGSISLSKEVTR